MSINRIIKGFTKAITQLERYELQQEKRKSFNVEQISRLEQDFSEAEAERSKASSIRSKLMELVS